MKLKFLTVLALLLVLISLSQVVEAVPITKGDFPSDGLTTIIDFDELAVGTIVDTEYAASGVTFAPGGVITFLAPGNVLSTSAQIIAVFSKPVDMVGVDYSSISTLWLEAYDADGNAIEIINTAAGDGFFGISSTTNIAKVIIHDSSYGFSIDNFTFHDPINGNFLVPEPGTLVLLGSGFLGIGVWGWRRKK